MKHRVLLGVLCGLLLQVPALAQVPHLGAAETTAQVHRQNLPPR